MLASLCSCTDVPGYQHVHGNEVKIRNVLKDTQEALCLPRRSLFAIDFTSFSR